MPRVISSSLFFSVVSLVLLLDHISRYAHILSPPICTQWNPRTGCAMNITHEPRFKSTQLYSYRLSCVIDQTALRQLAIQCYFPSPVKLGPTKRPIAVRQRTKKYTAPCCFILRAKLKFLWPCNAIEFQPALFVRDGVIGTQCPGLISFSFSLSERWRYLNEFRAWYSGCLVFFIFG
jgi:hypothetical protein